MSHAWIIMFGMLSFIYVPSISGLEASLLQVLQKTRRKKHVTIFYSSKNGGLGMKNTPLPSISRISIENFPISPSHCQK